MKRLLAVLVLFAGMSGVSLARELPDFTDLVDKLGPAVVNISTTQTIRNERAFPQIPNLPDDDPMSEFFRHFVPPHGVPREFHSRSLGSGFIVSPDGYIVTNAHVVDAADEVVVRLTDRREFKAKVVGSDRRTDVALLKIDAANLPKVVIGKPDALKVGEWVIAIGSPFGFENSVTAGIVSAKGRSLPQENLVPFIQTDVAINPGNSGGPLINMKGEVVGVNSQIFSRTGGYMGLSFAIPIDVAMDVGDQLRIQGRVNRGWLGVYIQDVTRELAESFGLATAGGALIANVEKGSPADKAGLAPSDVVLKFDGRAINRSAELPRLVATARPGKRVVLTVWRRGAFKEVALVVGERPERGATPPARKIAPAGNKLGLSVLELSEAQKKELKIENGVVVDNADGAAARAGLSHGDVILAVNNFDVKSVAQFNELLNQYGLGRSIALLVRRGERSIYIPIRPNGK